jgi:N-succinyl-L-ornithine transcarbamylase
MLNQFLSADDVSNFPALMEDALYLKQHPFACSDLGRGKTLGLVFFNPSLRTRLSSQKAAHHLGLHVLSINVNQEGWTIETQDGVVMDGAAGEHLKEAAGVLAQYCDIIGIRCFPSLKDREADYAEEVLTKFARYSQRPIISLESATGHPLQGLADVMTIVERQRRPKPKVVLTWAPHIKPLPQAVPNSFAQWTLRAGFDLTIVHPEGYELDERFTRGATIMHDQDQALEGADFVYAKSWSSFHEYGQILCHDRSWMITDAKMDRTNQGYFMHCLPVRRNLKVADSVLDSPRSLVLQQAHNRIFAAQAVMKNILESM